MFDKLEEVEKRYIELTKKISDPEVISNQSEWQKLMKEHASIEDIVLKFREYKKAKEANIIYFKNGMYTFADNVILGATDQAAVAWLADPSKKNTLKLIQSQVYPEYNPSNLDENKLEENSKNEFVSLPNSVSNARAAATARSTAFFATLG